MWYIKIEISTSVEFVQRTPGGGIAIKRFFSNERVKKIGRACKKILQFCLNPRLLLCFGIAWLITNGWSYVFAAVGAFFGITWMTVLGGAWAAVLWFPFTPEKVITLIIAIFLLRLLFPKDEKTLLVLRTELQKIRTKMQKASTKRKANRRVKWLKKELAMRRQNNRKG